MKEKPAIELHTGELDSLGIKLEPIEELKESVMAAHRDDHYMFILQQKGRFLCEIDFSEMLLHESSLCFVAPGQVHRYLQQERSQGWFIFVDTGLVAEQYRQIFDTHQHSRQVVSVQPGDVVFDTVPLLEQLLLREHHALQSSLVASLTATILGIIAARIVQSGSSGHSIGSQKYHIAIRFKQLVKQHYKERKQVLQYAERLNITPLYLNEVVKEITGFPASYWIQQEIVLEAKRLLYYTAMDVKQVAYELGYEDHTYFSRFFKKHTGTTAVAFRIKNHHLSNQSH